MEADLDGLDDEGLARHMERVGKCFDEMASKTNGVLTYYYRIDQDLQHRLEEEKGQMAFAVGVFDCDNLKTINDKYGHEKGDIYLKTASRLICRVFQHSPVFRIGGDEFAVILKNDDFQRRDELVRQFEEESAIIDAENETEWKQVQVAMGIAVYDPRTDIYVIDTVKRADQSMYANKQERKKAAGL